MDKYERRRLRLIQLRDDTCGKSTAELARRIGKDPSYVARMLYPEGKDGKKRIGDDLLEAIERAFNLSRGALDAPLEGDSPQTTLATSRFSTDGDLIEWCYTTLEGMLSPVYLADKSSIPKRARAIGLMYETLKEEKGDLEAAKERMTKWLTMMFQ